MVNNIEKKLARVIRKSAQEKMPDFLMMDDIQILMPLEVTLIVCASTCATPKAPKSKRRAYSNRCFMIILLLVKHFH